MRLLLDGKQMLDFSVCHKSRHRYPGSNWVVTVAVTHFAANANSVCNLACVLGCLGSAHVNCDLWRAIRFAYFRAPLVSLMRAGQRCVRNSRRGGECGAASLQLEGSTGSELLILLC